MINLISKFQIDVKPLSWSIEGMPPSDLVLRVQALESLLIEKGLVDPAAIDVLVDTYETKIGPRNGARVVARAWSD